MFLFVHKKKLLIFAFDEKFKQTINQTSNVLSFIKKGYII